MCGLPGRTLPEQLTGRRYVVLDGVQDPGNVGTILRTADAFHADGLFLVNACADLYNPKTVRASMGAVFRCPVWTCGLEELRRC
ncbi:MAG: TrmH family RNA methyltransferase [Dysosmobacter welbionis]